VEVVVAVATAAAVVVNVSWLELARQLL